MIGEYFNLKVDDLTLSSLRTSIIIESRYKTFVMIMIMMMTIELDIQTNY